MPQIHKSDNGEVPTQPARTGLWTWAICVLLALAVIAVFGRTVRFEFVNLDDNKYVYENPLVAGGLTAPGVLAAFTRFHVHYWSPLTWISYLVDHQFCGMQPWGYHLDNVLLHAAAAILLFLVLRRMTGTLWPSAVAAMLFAVHPLRVESVAWVTERKDVLSGVFFMLTLGAYARYARHPFALRRYLAVAALLALGLMAKPMLVTLPFVLLLLDYWPLARVARGGSAAAAAPAGNQKTFAWLLLEKVPLLVLSVAAGVLILLATADLSLSPHASPLPWRLANMLVAYAAYLGMMVYPVGLAVLYPYAGANLPAWQIVVAAVVLAGISTGVIAGARRYPYLLVGWLWYLGMLAPVIQVWQTGLPLARADRFTYLPQIGLTILLVWAARDFCGGRRGHRWALGVGAGLLIALLGAGARLQAGYWCDSETLWRRTLACTSRNCVAHCSLGNALADRRQFAEAIAEYQQALKIHPNFDVAHNNLGAALVGCGQFAEAVLHLRKALEINPNYAEVHCNLGAALTGLGRVAEAIAEYHQMLKINPHNAPAQNNLAWIRATHPDPKVRNGVQAVTLARRAVEVSPNNLNRLDTLAAAYAESGRFAEAAQTARRALDLATQQNQPALAKDLQAQLRLYEAGTPYRESPQAPPSRIIDEHLP